MTKITFIRHGQTQANILGLFSGITNPELTKTGICQAEDIGEKLKKEKFDAVLAGKTKRVVKTAQIVFEKLINKPQNILYDERIRETNFGEFENKSCEELENHPKWNEYMEKWTDFTFPNGDNTKKYFDKCGFFIKDIVLDYKDKNVLIIGSKGFICACICNIKGLDISHLFDFKCENCSPVEILV